MQTGIDFASWQQFPTVQQPTYPDQGALDQVKSELRSRPPLVFAGEVDRLLDLMAAACEGKAFVLTGGDCAETFAQSTADRLRLKIQTILQMAIVLTYGGSLPVVKLGRMAGQYAKPRSSDTETIDEVTLPSYRGDAVNGHQFTAQDRRPDPNRLMEMYNRSGTTLNLIRAFTQGGYADLHRVHEWNKGFTSNPAYKRYEDWAEQIERAIAFMDASGVDDHKLRTTDFYAAHEALLLDYEESLARIDSRTGGVYATTAHYLWIGERTRDPEGGHVQFLSQVKNPVGIKIGPEASAQDLFRLQDRLNPSGEAGRISFITRMGAQNLHRRLPQLLEEVKADGRPVTWICDPMHGNTIQSEVGYKTRRFDAIMQEVKAFFEAHDQVGTIPGGIHVEMTGDDVTEVTGGSEQVTDQQLVKRYETLVDPRLNHQQSLEMAFQVAQMLQDRHDILGNPCSEELEPWFE